MNVNSVIFREYDIRGVYNEHFDKEFAYHLGKSMCAFVKNKFPDQQPILTVGYDARHSSPELSKAIGDGIADSGGKAIHLGLVTTPVCYYSTFNLEGVNGAVMVTGSHNPPEYNGFKLSVGNTTIYGEDIQKLKAIIQEEKYLKGEGSQETYDIFPEYVERYKKEFGDLNKLPIVIDCGNGAAGSIARRLYEAVGLEPHFLFEEPDGDFPNHHPDPTVMENLEDLIKKVKETNSVVGIGFDGDGDRIGLVDEQGNVIQGDEIIVLCSRFILKDNPGLPIVGDVKCSDRLYDDIAKHGGKPVMWKTGHSLIKKKIRDEKSPFGGELSGHIFFADRNYGYDDALYAGLRIVEILAKTGKTLSELLSDLPTAFNTPEIRVDTTEEKKHSIVAKLKEVFHEGGKGYSVNYIDGVRVSFPDGWALARASNTQPVLVLRFEANTQESMNEMRRKFEEVIQPLV